MNYTIDDIPFRQGSCQRTKSKDQIIEDLEEKLAFYKSELGIQIENTQIHKMCKSLDIRPGCAYFIMALYNARCRVMTWEQLIEIIPGQHRDKESEDERGPRLINVYATIARKVLGEKCIETAWGTGYCMTVAGKSRVLATLNPVEESNVKDLG